MENINKNIIMQAGAAVANATNKAAGLSASTPEPGTIISAIQLVNGGRTIGPEALAHFTESVRNKLLSLLVRMEPIQSGTGVPSPDNVRPITGRTGLNVYVSPTQNVADATTYAVDWTSEAGTVYGGTLDVVTGLLTVDTCYMTVADKSWALNNGCFRTAAVSTGKAEVVSCSAYKIVSDTIAPSDRDDMSINCGNTTSNETRLYIKDTSFNGDANAFMTAMASCQIVFKLVTPLTYQLTAQDIITLVGDNYIWSDSGDVTITE